MQPESTSHAQAATQPALPVLDLEPYLRDDPGACAQLAVDVHDALTQVGFFFIVNHGIPQDLIDRVFHEAARFHDLPLDAKMALQRNAANAGYVPLGGGRSRSSALDAHHKPNLNAAFFMKRDRGQNQWPGGVPGFRETLLDYFHAMETLGKRCLPLFAMALDLPPEYFDAFFHEPECTLRLSIYPPIAHEEHQYGLAPHTDGGFITFLPHNDVPGLSIRPEGWDWMEPPALPGSYLVNSGDILQRWTNDRFLSTSHCAFNASGRNRYAIPYFFNPTPDVLIECLSTCHGPDTPPKYSPITYAAYNRWFTNNNYRSDPNEPPVPRP